MMRARHEVKTVNISATDKDGNELFTIESFEDKTQRTFYQTIDENEYIDTVDKLLDGLKTDYSIIIKLQLLYYFDLTQREIEEISSSSGKNKIEILQFIEKIRKELEEKSRTMTQKEMQLDKIYSIKRDLSFKLERLKKEEREGKDITEEMEEIQRKLAKRKTQFEKMMDEKEKGLFIIRASHKTIAELLGVTENAVSIRIHRAEKALKEKMDREDLI